MLGQTMKSIGFLGFITLVILSCTSPVENLPEKDHSPYSGIMSGYVSNQDQAAASGALVVVEREIAGLSPSLLYAVEQGGRDPLHFGRSIPTSYPPSLSELEEGLSRSSSVLSTMTDSQGYYEFQGLADGFYTVKVQKENTLGFTSSGIFVASGSQIIVDVVLTATGSIRGEVGLNRDGASLFASFIYLSGTSYIAATDHLGQFTLTNVPVGEYEAVFYHEGYTTQTLSSVVVEAAQTTVLAPRTLEFKGSPPVIQSLSADPFIAGAEQSVSLAVMATDPDGEDLSYLWSAPEGTFLDPSAPLTQFTTPSQEGSVVVSLEVSDGVNTVQGQLVIMVTSQTVVSVTGVSLPASTIINRGESQQLQANVLPASATLKAVNWSSDDPGIASVDVNGVVSAHSKGTATITATTQDGGFTAQTEVEVWVPVSGVLINPESIVVGMGQSYQLQPTIFPLDASNKNVLWISQNPGIATVTPEGRIDSISEGETIIFGETEEGLYPLEVALTSAPEKSALFAKGVVHPSGTASRFTSIAVDDKGSIYTGGTQLGNVNYDYGNGVSLLGGSQTTGTLVKYDHQGNALWVKAISSPSKPVGISKLVISKKENVFLVGYIGSSATVNLGNGISYSNTSSYTVHFLAKYNSDGTPLWIRGTTSPPETNSFSSLGVDEDENIYVVGNQKGAGSFNYGGGVVISGSSSSEFNAVLLKYDENGNTIWGRTTVSGTRLSNFSSVKVLENGNIVVVGSQNGNGSYNYGSGVSLAGSAGGTSPAYANPIILQYNSSGVTQWGRTMISTSSTSSGTYFLDVDTDSAGNLYVVGQMGLGTNSFGVGVSLDSPSASASSNALIVKYSESGVPLWAKSLWSSTNSSRYLSISIDQEDSIYLSGSFHTGSFEMEPGGYNFFLSYQAPLLVEYSTSGQVLHIQLVQGSDNSSPGGIDRDRQGNIFLTGFLQGLNPFNFGNGQTVIPSAAIPQNGSPYTGFLAKYTP